MKFKFKDHRRITSDGNKIVFNLSNMGAKPSGPLLSFMGMYVGECSRIWSYYPIYPATWKHVSESVKTHAFEQFFLVRFETTS